MSNSLVAPFNLDEFNRLLSMAPLGFEGSRNSRSALNYSIRTEDDTAVAEVEVPGIDPSDVKVRIEGRSLTVETPRGSAYFTIGARIDADHATADLKHGLLTIRIPKREAKLVEVSVHTGA